MVTAKTFDELASRTMSKANRKRAAERTKALLRKTVPGERRMRTQGAKSSSGPDAEKSG